MILKTRAYWVVAAMALIALTLAVWAPWLPKGGDRAFLESFRRSDAFRSAAMGGTGGVSDVYCTGLDVSWVPFGRKIAYCDHAVWRMDVLGDIAAVHIEKYARDPDRDAQLRTFAYFRNGTARELCRKWNPYAPVLVTAEYVSIGDPLPVDREAKMRFKGANGDFFLMLPYDAIAKGGYVAGEKYTVDMNDLCIYEHRFLKTEPMDPEWANYILPTPAS